MKLIKWLLKGVGWTLLIVIVLFWVFPTLFYFTVWFVLTFLVLPSLESPDVQPNLQPMNTITLTLHKI